MKTAAASQLILGVVEMMAMRSYSKRQTIFWKFHEALETSI
jgi:hypothetical protein